VDNQRSFVRPASVAWSSRAVFAHVHDQTLQQQQPNPSTIHCSARASSPRQRRPNQPARTCISISCSRRATCMGCVFASSWRVTSSLLEMADSQQHIDLTPPSRRPRADASDSPEQHQNYAVAEGRTARICSAPEGSTRGLIESIRVRILVSMRCAFIVLVLLVDRNHGKVKR
jgi:hypothetical protein